MKKLYNSAWGIIHDSLRGIHALVVRKLDSAIQQINRYPEDKYYDNQLRYIPVDSNNNIQWIVLSTFRATEARRTSAELTQ